MKVFRKIFKFGMLSAMGFVFLLVFQSISYATPTLIFWDVKYNEVFAVADNSVYDSNPAIGVINYNFNAVENTGVYSVNITASTGSLSTPSMSLSGSVLWANELFVAYTNIGYTPGSPELYTLDVSSALGNAAFGQWYDPANQLASVDTVNKHFNAGSLLSPIIWGTGTGTGIASLSGPYSLTIAADISGGGGGTFDMELIDATVPVPEPTSLILLGLGLAGIGIVRRKK